MSWSYDWTTNPVLARIRLMVGDTDSSTPIYQDEECMGALQANTAQAYIVGLSNYNPVVPQVFSYGRAAALLLNSLSAAKARLVVLKVLDVNVDGTKAAQALQALAKQYIEQEASSGYFAVAEMGNNAFWMRERLYNVLLRMSS